MSMKQALKDLSECGQRIGAPLAEGMVRAVIDLPAPPVPYERIVFRLLTSDDWFFGTNGVWVKFNGTPDRTRPYICLDLPAETK